MRQNQKGSAMIVVLCVLSVVIILGLSMAAISGSSRSATVKNQHNQQAYYTARSVLDGVRIPMERTAALNKWKMVGEVLIPGVLNVGDINKTDGCAQAAALADKI